MSRLSGRSLWRRVHAKRRHRRLSSPSTSSWPHFALRTFYISRTRPRSTLILATSCPADIGSRDIHEFQMETVAYGGSRREAAKKASKLAAEQLDSSSEDERVVEATKERKRVTRPRSLSKISQVSKSMPSIQAKPRSTSSAAPTALPSSQPSRRKSLPKLPAKAKQTSGASSSKPSFLSTPSELESDSDIEFLGSGPGLPSTSKPKSSVVSSVGHRPPFSSNAMPSLRIPMQTPTKKRVLSTAELFPMGSLDDLSPLTSPEAIRRSPRSLGASSSHDDPPSPAGEGWSLATLGHLVWVRIDLSGNVSERRSNTVWWPAQVIRNSPLRLSLYGRSPGSKDSSTSVNVEVEIIHPSHLNVRSLTLTAYTLRFTPQTYGGLGVTSRTSILSPRKRQKTADYDLQARWEEARNLMVKQDTRDNDGFPRFLSLDVEIGLSDDPDIDEDFTMDTTPAVEETPWRPPPPGFQYEIPGELVLAKDKLNGTQYWPAKMLEYIPPKSPKQKPKYKILFFDGTTKDVAEDMFFTESQDGFATCKLGECEGNYGLDEEERDTDEDTGPEEIDEDEDALRASTPIPDIPPPKFFESIPVDEQFEYVKPILIAMLQNRYEPGRARHNAFMNAATRQGVLDSEHLSGDLRADELEELGPLLRRWIRRRRRRQALGLIPDDLPAGPDEPIYTPPPPSTVGSEPDHFSTTDIMSDDGAASKTDPLSEGSLPPSSFVSAADSEPKNATKSQDAIPIDAVEPDHIVVATGADDEPPNPSQDARGEALFVDKSIPVLSEHRASGTTKSFSSLSEIDQLTYCTTVLQQEAKYQLLLWRHQLRHSLELLSPAEEEKLRQRAKELSTETDWVHVIIQSRRLVEGKMLPTNTPSSSRPQKLTRLRSGRD
ncbi:hypothetical protein EIP91_000320 [Steccherinum ochraceum]|uniref:PWWP domain-containing protein n=1 Tax=Steccherinum ochraceum TaxID=92696 RepID=A0A4V2MWR5_9APHY|nr:hypothetical protein EIP91_000320 [Steccherinum ochraceum]